MNEPRSTCKRMCSQRCPLRGDSSLMWCSMTLTAASVLPAFHEVARPSNPFWRICCPWTRHGRTTTSDTTSHLSARMGTSLHSASGDSRSAKKKQAEPQRHGEHRAERSEGECHLLSTF